MLYESKMWPVKEVDVIRLERNDPRMVRWIVMLEQMIEFELFNLGIDSIIP